MKALLKHNRTEFNSLALANSFADNCIKIHMIVLGDNGKFWVMLPKFSEVLVNNGFQYA